MSEPAVVLVHGFATSARRTWAEPGWIDLLSEAGREVIAPDLLGHGSSPKPHEPEEYANVEQLVFDQFPQEPVDAIGYSAGARILLVLAANHPERFRRLVVGGVGGRLLIRREGNPILDALQGNAPPDDRTAAHFRELAATDGNDPSALEAFIGRSQPRLDPEDLARITAPTLIVIGDRDFAGPGEPLADAINGSELVTLRGVDHFGLPKAFPFVEKALDFLGAAPF